MNYVFYGLIEDALSTVNNQIFDKEAYLRHQERDLPGCWPAEKEGREAEIEELKEDLKEYYECRTKLEELLSDNRKT